MKRIKLNKEKSNFKLLASAFYISLLLSGKNVYCNNNDNNNINQSGIIIEDNKFNSSLNNITIIQKNNNNPINLSSMHSAFENIKIDNNKLMSPFELKEKNNNNEIVIVWNQDLSSIPELIDKKGNKYKKIIYTLGTRYNNITDIHYYVAAELFKLNNRTMVIHRDSLAQQLNQEFVDYVKEYIDKEAIIVNISRDNLEQNLDNKSDSGLIALYNLEDNKGVIDKARNIIMIRKNLNLIKTNTQIIDLKNNDDKTQNNIILQSNEDIFKINEVSDMKKINDNYNNTENEKSILYLETCIRKLTTSEKRTAITQNWTLLMYAARVGDIKGIKMFMNQVGKQDKLGFTALMFAASKGHTEIVELLKDKEAGMRNNEKVTALMLAAKNGHTEIIKLLSNTKELVMKNKEGKTALTIAREKGNTEIIDILESEIKKTDLIDEKEKEILLSLYSKEGSNLFIDNNKERTKNAKNKENIFNSFIVNNHPLVYKDSLNSDFSRSIKESSELSENELKIQIKSKLEKKNSSLLYILSHISMPDESSINEQNKTNIIFFNTGEAKEKLSISKDSEIYKAINIITECNDHYSLIKELQDENGNKYKKIIYAVHTEDGTTILHREVLEPIGLDNDDTIILKHENKLKETVNMVSDGNGEKYEKIIPEDEKSILGNIYPYYYELEYYIEKYKEKLLKSEKMIAITNKWTQLMCIARVGDIENIEKFIYQSEARDNDNWTALMHAVYNGHTEIVKLLMNTKEVGMQNNKGTTALMFAARKNYKNIVELLIGTEEVGKQDSEKWTALMFAVTNNHRNIVSLLSLTSEASIINNDNTTALMMAVENNNKDLIEILANDISLGVKNKYGMTASMLAAKLGYNDILKILISKKKELKLKDKYGMTALMYAVQNNNIEAILLLESYESGIQDILGQTALMISVSKGYEDRINNINIINILSRSKDIGKKDKEGKTALIYSIENNNIEYVKILSRTEELFRCNKKNNKYPLFYAKNKENKDIENILSTELKKCEFNYSYMLKSSIEQKIADYNNNFTSEDMLEKAIEKSLSDKIDEMKEKINNSSFDIFEECNADRKIVVKDNNNKILINKK